VVKKNKKAIDEIKNIAKGVYNKIIKKKSPSLVTPLRSLTNVKYDPKDGYFELLGKKKENMVLVNKLKERRLRIKEYY